MKKFFQIFLICQLFVFSFIYGQSIYDIFTLNHLSSSDLNDYYLENCNGENLSILYDALDEHNSVVEIIKTPISNNNILRYEIYTTSLATIQEMIPITKNKEFSYYELQKDDFIDSTGKFSCSLDYAQIKDIASQLDLVIKKYDSDNIDYKQVFVNNFANIVALLLLSQFMMFVFTFMRSKMNAIKILHGYSYSRIIFDSLTSFGIMQAIASVVIFFLHFVFCAANRCCSPIYFFGLFLTMVIVSVINIILLFITKISIRFIDINAMMKNKTFSGTLSNLMLVMKIMFAVLLTASISLFIVQYTEYQQVNSQIDKYLTLSQYYTSNGFNSDSYEKVFRDPAQIRQVSKNTKALYNHFQDKLLVMDVNITNFMSETYLKLHNTSVEQLMHSYKTNYIVVNETYFEEYMELYDADGNRIHYASLAENTVLVPEEYKGSAVEDFCTNQYNDMLCYDSYYGCPDEATTQGSVHILYIANNQKTQILTPYQLKTGESIVNSVVFFDFGTFAGTWYLDKLSDGKIAVLTDDREEFAVSLKEHALDDLLNVGTLLTPLSEEIYYYDFTMKQTGVFALLFSVALITIIYLSNYTEIIVNRKQYAIKHLLGFSATRALVTPFLSTGIMLLLLLPIKLLHCNVLVLLAAIVLDVVFTVFLHNRIIVKNTVNNLKGE